MAKQLHNRFFDEQIKELLSMYLKREITRKPKKNILLIKNYKLQMFLDFKS